VPRWNFPLTANDQTRLGATLSETFVDVLVDDDAEVA